MTNEMTYSFYSLISEFVTLRGAGSRRRQLNALISEARRAAAEANQENIYGEQAMSALRNAPFDAREQILRHRNLSELAIRHFRRCAELYRESAVNFESAAEFAALNENRQKLQAKAAELRKRAEQAECAANAVQRFLKCMDLLIRKERK
jgi:hypothetical protein